MAQALPLSDEQCQEVANALLAHGNVTAAAKALNMPRATFDNRLRRASERGFMGYKPVLTGFEISKISSTLDAYGNVKSSHVQQKPERQLSPFNLPEGHVVKGVSALVDANGNVQQSWYKTAMEDVQRDALMRAAFDELKLELPRLAPRVGPARSNADLLNQYTITDSHFGMLAHAEETGADYDLKIAEQLILDWFAAAINQSPDAHTAVLAQIGDLMHHDALESVTPAHKHVLDADSRLHKVIRAVIRTMRRVIDMLLDKHQHVHVVMASGNHDPASSVWLREMLSVLYEGESRITVDTSPKLYYAYMWGKTLLTYHHGHKRGINNVDATIVGMFKELYGQSNYAYCHIGHFHSDEGKKSNLMYVERHETLAAPDAYAAGGGYLSGRSAKRITYHKEYGEVGRDTLRPEMVTT